MQPYFFPYLGYYQLFNHVDHFIFLDDVNFIKKGYINRNHILLNSRPHKFTLAIKNSSQNKKINELFFKNDFNKLKKTIYLNYRKSKNFDAANELIENIFKNQELNVAKLSAQTIISIFNIFKKKLSYSFSSEYPSELKSQERIVSLCKLHGATEYYNPIGGIDLYDPKFFKKNDLNLKFFQGIFPEYYQYGLNSNHAFVPCLSMIDILMNNYDPEIAAMLEKGKVI